MKRLYCLKCERNDYAKRIRRDYEAGRIKERRCNMKQYTIRKDDCINTLTTVLKDNYILEIVNEVTH